ncbi:T9SS type A sorting domain-containing protein [Arcicella rigui]|uniref:T9SS type A sorting domain-containing protein n=1 Tax=Arcicella rigui TaxID=797020 RepID=A0ABU5QCG4_9BACT|nr:T9SS type A sorting domain-containing protein [Arcicella rigui]MEA5140293.1 T9SS type A sorting domain-containing protein [Arcicella rigui]
MKLSILFFLLISTFWFTFGIYHSPVFIKYHTANKYRKKSISTKQVNKVQTSTLVQTVKSKANKVHEEATIVGQKIPIDAKRWYQLNHIKQGLGPLFDGSTETAVPTDWERLLLNFDAYYPLKEGEKIEIQSIRFYDGEGIETNTPFRLYGITDKWKRVYIATFTGERYNQWVGPNPPPNNSFVLSNPPTENFRYLLINCYGEYPTEMELYGNYTPPTVKPKVRVEKNIKMKDNFGINAFEWDFLQRDDASKIDEKEMATFAPFSCFRQYMDWNRIEPFKQKYTYNPCYSGGWNYDIIYERCKQENIEVLPCLQGIPEWMYENNPEEKRNSDLVPVIYGKDFADPHSYIEQAQAGFQYIARYGSNTNIDTTLLTIYDQPRWTNDYVNVRKVGLGIVKYIECGNERDKWWKGRDYYQTAREYAANLSAFYDGHKNTMGIGVGVKNADPTVKVVMAGLAYASTDYVRGMIDWCKEFRGYNPDGSVNICWDVINYHLYSNDSNSNQTGNATRGVAPEVSNAGEVAKEFVQLAHEELNDMPVWITELGYDLNQKSPLKAIPIGDKPAIMTQADWGLRSALMYNRLGIARSFFYMLTDFDINNGTQFASSGLIDANKNRRPLADYLYQTKNLLGEYIYKETISQNPLVDRYELDGKSAYMLVVPDEKGTTIDYTLKLKRIKDIQIFKPKAGSDTMDSQGMKECSGKFNLQVSETPMFIIPGTVRDPNITDECPPIEDEPEEEIILGTEENINATIFPNPTSEVLFITTANVNLINTIKLIGLDGTTVLKTNTYPTNGIDVKSLPSGNYVLSIGLKNGKEEIQKVSIVK